MEWEGRRTAPPQVSRCSQTCRRTIPRRIFALEKGILPQVVAVRREPRRVPSGCLCAGTMRRSIVMRPRHRRSGQRFYKTCKPSRRAVVTRIGQGGRGWLAAITGTYKNDGTLVGVPERRDSPIDLSAAAADGALRVYGKLILYFDENAMSMLDWLGPLAEKGPNRFDKIRLLALFVRAQCNGRVGWKRTWGYHVPFICRAGCAVVDSRQFNSSIPTVMPDARRRASTNRGMSAASIPHQWQQSRAWEPAGHDTKTDVQLGLTAVQLFVRQLCLAIGKHERLNVTMAPDWGDGPHRSGTCRTEPTERRREQDI